MDKEDCHVSLGIQGFAPHFPPDPKAILNPALAGDHLAVLPPNKHWSRSSCHQAAQLLAEGRLLGAQKLVRAAKDVQVYTKSLGSGLCPRDDIPAEGDEK